MCTVLLCAAGAVFLFCKAHQQMGGADARFLAAAQRSGEAVRERGLLKKGPGCCHGVSGSAYALLRLYRTTGQDKWLHRALEFAKFMNRCGQRHACGRAAVRGRCCFC